MHKHKKNLYLLVHGTFICALELVKTCCLQKHANTFTYSNMVFLFARLHLQKHVFAVLWYFYLHVYTCKNMFLQSFGTSICTFTLAKTCFCLQHACQQPSYPTTLALAGLAALASPNAENRRIDIWFIAIIKI